MTAKSKYIVTSRTNLVLLTAEANTILMSLRRLLRWQWLTMGGLLWKAMYMIFH